MKKKVKICAWYLSDDETTLWESTCGKAAFEFNEGGPEENNFNFCPHCGLQLSDASWDIVRKRNKP